MTYSYEDKISFIKQLYCPARVVADETGCSWELILAQAAQETGWGEKVLPGTNNIFNIKADSSWEGASKTFNVPEIIGGKRVQVDAAFRSYPDMVASLRDRVAFLKDNPRYAKAGLYDVKTKGNLELEATALQKAGYATDPDYATNLSTVFNGKTMQKAIAEAQKVGCAAVLPMIELFFKDGAKVPIASAKVQIEHEGRSVEGATDASGRLIVKITPKSMGAIKLKIFDAKKNAWIAVDSVDIPTPIKSITVTMIAPTFSVQTSTRVHDKPAAAVAQTAPAPKVSTDKPAGKLYTIVAGDTLASIASKHHLRYKTLAEFNHIASPYIIRPGQQLHIPPIEREPAATSSSHAQTDGDSKGKEEATGAYDIPAHIALAAGSIFNNCETFLHSMFYRDAANKPTTAVVPAERAPWMKFAEEEFKAGVRRHKENEAVNAHILSYFKATPSVGKSAASTDKTPYCAAFANWCLVKSGYAGDASAWAADFKKWGRSTKDNKPALGAVAVVKFPKSTQHHVTFVAGLSKDGKFLLTLGGNQGKAHEVSHGQLPINWVVAFRYPANYPDYADDYVLHVVKSDHAPMTAKSTH